MQKQLYILLLLVPVLFCACTDKTGVTLPTFSKITVTPEQATYAVGDQVECSVTMLTPGDASLKQATYWFYTSWLGSDPDMTADFCQPDTVDGVISFTSSPITLTEKGEVRIYFWGRLEYPNWDFQPIQIPVTLKVE
ncbi:MAG: hypothetical protein J6T76_05450 [Paludibacteraceae bacterium]|nr:hypothetical protein [Paludibacteraceae bacterium]